MQKIISIVEKRMFVIIFFQLQIFLLQHILTISDHRYER
jgi:hypothetical protein